MRNTEYSIFLQEIVLYTNHQWATVHFTKQLNMSCLFQWQQDLNINCVLKIKGSCS